MRRWLHRMQYKYSRYGIENLMMYVTVTMLAVYLADLLLNIPAMEYISFSRAHIFDGQVWRLLSFVFTPPSDSPIFLFFALYMYYFFGTALENEWGTFSFNIYYLLGILGAIVGGLLTGFSSNSYLNLSLMLAFAQLAPNLELRIFFMIPVKIKYIGYATWIIYAIGFLFSLVMRDWAGAVAVLMSMINFFIFFGEDIIKRFREWQRYGKRRRQFKRDVRQNPNNRW